MTYNPINFNNGKAGGTPVSASNLRHVENGIVAAHNDIATLTANVNSLSERYGTPLVAHTAAEMTDNTKIYVYVGSETGYTTGDWYYYDGDSWESGGAYNSIAVNTDKTLTQTDMAADSKKVGDEISDLKSALNVYKVKFVTGNIGLGGGEGTNESFIRSDFCPIDDETIIYLNDVYTGQSANAYSFYRENKTFIEGYNNISGNVTVSTIPTGAKYVRICTQVSSGHSVNFSAFIGNQKTINNAIYISNELPKQLVLNQKGIQTFFGYGNFQHYGLNTDGSFKTSQQYRVSNDDPIVFDRPITVSVKSGFKWGYIPFTGSTPGSWVGWLTGDYTIPENTSFVAQIAKDTEDTSLIADVNEFVDAVTFTTNIMDEINNCDQKIESIKNSIVTDIVSSVDDGMALEVNTIFGSEITVNGTADSRDGSDVYLNITGLNMIPYPHYRAGSYEKNGVTFTENNDGTISLSGTATSDITYEVWKSGVRTTIAPTLSKKYIILVGCPEGGSSSTYYLSWSWMALNDYGNGVAMPASQYWNKNRSAVSIVIKSGTNVTGKVFKPMAYPSISASPVYTYNDYEKYVGISKLLAPTSGHEYTISETLSSVYGKQNYIFLVSETNGDTEAADTTLISHLEVEWGRVGEQPPGVGSNEYYGEKIQLALSEDIFNCDISLWKSFTTENTENLSSYWLQANQSIAIYGGYLFIFKDGGGVVVVDYQTKSIVYSGSLTPTTRNHQNSAQFSNIFYDAEDDFPLLFVARCGNTSSGSGDDTCLVYRVTQTGSTFAFELVTTIDTDIRTYGNSWCVDNANRTLNMVGYVNGTYEVTTNNPICFFSWRLPTKSELLESQTINLTQEDCIAQTTIGYDLLQSACANGGKVYIGVGSSGLQYVYVVDVAQGMLKTKLPLTDRTEVEGVYVYNGFIYVSHRTTGTTLNPLRIYEIQV